MGNIGDEEGVDQTLARELPKLASGISRPRLDFDVNAADLRPGPVGPAAFQDEKLPSLALPRVPRIRPTRFGSAIVANPLVAGYFPLRIEIAQPSLFIVYQWSTTSQSMGTVSIAYGPTPEDQLPDPLATTLGEIAWSIGFGNLVYLPSAGVWTIILTTSIVNTQDTAQWMLVDATNPQFARLYTDLVRARPNFHTFQTDVTLAALGSAIIVPNNLGGIRTCIRVSNTGGGIARLAFAGANPAGALGIPLAPATATNIPAIEFKQETLPEGELRAFSTAGTTLSVAVFTQNIARI